MYAAGGTGRYHRAQQMREDDSVCAQPLHHRAVILRV
jgi:hypothetical protein